MTDEEAFAEMEKDARRLPKGAVKTDRKNSRFYPETMTSFGQFEAGSPCTSYVEAKALADRLTLEAKEYMVQALKKWIGQKKLRRAKP